MNTLIIEPQVKPIACVIWMHGLGASADDMLSLAKELPLNVPVRHVALQAPRRPVTLNQGMVMPAWYDIVGLTLTAREDKLGIMQSEQLIREAIQTQIEKGLSAAHIYLAGFSQGGAMALFSALRSNMQLGGGIALSAYLPLAETCQPTLPKTTPFFIASGTQDDVVLPAWTAQSVSWLKNTGYEALTVHTYPMAHSVCLEEIQALAIWLTKHITSAHSTVGDIS